MGGPIANPWVGKNYIPDNVTREVPPAFFLSRIWDQDAMLVVLPSRKTPHAYVIARRKQFGPGLTEAAIDAQYAQPDTKMCVMHGCVPVCLMFKTGSNWDADPIIRSLRARDLWAHGGANKVADMLEAQEEADKAANVAAIRADLYERSGEGWRTYQARTGASTIKHGEHRKAQPRQGRRIYSNSPSGSTPTGSVTLT
jgi:hypothetical protein